VLRVQLAEQVDEPPSLRWRQRVRLDFVIAVVAIFSGVLRAGPTRQMRGSEFALGAALVGASAYALFAGCTVWLSSWNAVVGLGFIVLGATPHFRRHVERLSRPRRHGHA
jgi:hypothetical protein